MDNVFDYTKTYYKITNKEENHNGFQFKDGLNEDVIPFNKRLCYAGGIYFSNIENIFRFLRYNDKTGYYIREVNVPDDAEISIEENKYKASKIILGERKELNLENIKYLVEQGAIIHVENESVLRWASQNGQLEVVKYLVEQGADIHVNNDYCLYWASNNGHSVIVKYLVEQWTNILAEWENGLYWASQNGQLEVVKYLVEQGVDISKNNEWSLRLASENGHLEVVKYLVEQGANIHAGDDRSLKYAAINGHLEVVKYLESLN